MRHLIALIISLIALSSSAQTPKMESTFNLFNILLDCPTEKDMIETCEYYGLTDHGTKDGYQNFSYTDGTELSFKMDTISPKQIVPVVEMSTKLSIKKIKENLNKLGYKQEGDQFFKGNEFSPVKVLCTISKKNKTNTHTLLFTKLYQ